MTVSMDSRVTSDGEYYPDDGETMSDITTELLCAFKDRFGSIDIDEFTIEWDSNRSCYRYRIVGDS